MTAQPTLETPVKTGRMTIDEFERIADTDDVFSYDETLTGGDVLPGFQMSFRDVFKNISVEQKS